MLTFVHPLMWFLISSSQTYLELRQCCPEHERGSFVCLDMSAPSFCPLNLTAGEESHLPVRLPRSKTTTFALIDPEDKDRLVKISPMWRVSSSGYIVCSKKVEGKYKVYYAHKEVLGGTGTHLNGNKFDNRKQNLALTRVHRIHQDVDFMIKTVSPIGDHVLSSEDVLINTIQENIISYPDGKCFFGTTIGNVPHGFGKLVENFHQKETIGQWIHGTFNCGIVIIYSFLPERMASSDVLNMRRIKHCFLVNSDSSVQVLL